METLWLFLSVFENLQCDVVHNDDSICKITSAIICFIVDKQFYTSNINIKMTKRPRCNVYQQNNR